MQKKKTMLNDVLFVGLSPALLKTLKQAFGKEPFGLHAASTAKEALSKVQSQEIAIVIYDQDSRKEAALAFVQKCSKLISHPSIIVLTKSKSAKNIRELFQSGAHDCLIKPMQISHLLHSVKQGLERRKAHIYGIKDPLTGLYNRYSFKDMLAAEIDRAQRYDRHLSLLMIDVDFFKRINDRFGHIIGDRVLVELGQILKSSFRKTDIITRFGGEEFAIILPETTIGHATMLAERIRKRIETYNYAHLIGSTPLTISIGISNYHTAGQKSDIKLIHSADKALYAAKKEGRNKVCISVPMKPKRATT